MEYPKTEGSIDDLTAFVAEMPIEDGQGPLADVTGTALLARRISKHQTMEFRYGGT